MHSISFPVKISYEAPKSNDPWDFPNMSPSGMCTWFMYYPSVLYLFCHNFHNTVEAVRIFSVEYVKVLWISRCVGQNQWCPDITQEGKNGPMLRPELVVPNHCWIHYPCGRLFNLLYITFTSKYSYMSQMVVHFLICSTKNYKWHDYYDW